MWPKKSPNFWHTFVRKFAAKIDLSSHTGLTTISTSWNVNSKKVEIYVTFEIINFTFFVRKKLRRQFAEFLTDWRWAAIKQRIKIYDLKLRRVFVNTCTNDISRGGWIAEWYHTWL